jgi:hypothetical protein
MTSKTCETCAHLCVIERNDEDSPAMIGECMRMRSTAGRIVTGTLAYGYDGEGVLSGLMVCKGFGCTMYERYQHADEDIKDER